MLLFLPVCPGKLLERSQKIAYNLHKVGSKADGAIRPGDRVSVIINRIPTPPGSVLRPGHHCQC